MCTVLLPPGVNPIAVHKYINIDIKKTVPCAEGVQVQMSLLILSLSAEAANECPGGCTVYM
jgi:hypothetical protein